jgi:hypothetical protein
VRTTLTLDDALWKQLRRAAEKAGVPFKEIVHRALSQGLAALDRPPRARRFRQRTFDMGYPSGGLDKALQLASDLEDEEVARKMALRK